MLKWQKQPRIWDKAHLIQAPMMLASNTDKLNCSNQAQTTSISQLRHFSKQSHHRVQLQTWLQMLFLTRWCSNRDFHKRTLTMLPVAQESLVSQRGLDKLPKGKVKNHQSQKLTSHKKNWRRGKNWSHCHSQSRAKRIALFKGLLMPWKLSIKHLLKSKKSRGYHHISTHQAHKLLQSFQIQYSQNQLKLSQSLSRNNKKEVRAVGKTLMMTRFLSSRPKRLT